MKTVPTARRGRPRRKLRRDLRTLALFTALYCRHHHNGVKRPLATEQLPVSVPELARYPFCSDCRALLRYAIGRRLACPLDPKPACRNCSINCYARPQLEAIRNVMGFAGPYLIRRGRFDLLWRLHFG